jgi:hypothetical protein
MAGPITLRNIRSNLDIGGVSKALQAASQGFGSSLGGIQNTLSGIEDQRNADATKAFQDQIAGLSAQELSDFDAQGAVNKRLGISDIQNLLGKAETGARAEETADFNFANSVREQKEAPIRAQVSTLIAQNIFEEAEELSKQLQDGSATIRGIQSQRDANQSRADNNTLRVNRAKELESNNRVLAADSAITGVLRDSTPGMTDVEFEKLFKASPAFKALKTNGERNTALDIARDSYAKTYKLTPSQLEEESKLDEQKRRELSVQLNSINEDRLKLGSRPGSTFPLNKPGSKSKTKAGVRKTVNELFEGDTNRPGFITGKGIETKMDSIMNKGLTVGGVSFSPSDIDGQVIIDTLKQVHESPKQNAVFDAALQEEAFDIALARNILSSKADARSYDVEKFKLDQRFNDYTRGIVKAPKEDNEPSQALSKQLQSAVSKLEAPTGSIDRPTNENISLAEFRNRAKPRTNN